MSNFKKRAINEAMDNLKTTRHLKSIVPEKMPVIYGAEVNKNPRLENPICALKDMTGFKKASKLFASAWVRAFPDIDVPLLDLHLSTFDGNAWSLTQRDTTTLIGLVLSTDQVILDRREPYKSVEKTKFVVH